MVDFGKTVANALRFSIDPKRWLPIFALDAVFGLAFLSYIITNIYALTSIMGAATSGLEVASGIIGVGLTVLAMGIIWFLIRLFISGALIHQSMKPKEIRKSCDVAVKWFIHLFLASVIVSILSVIVSWVPAVGWLLSIIIGIIFFFAMPAVVAGKQGFVEALRDSYRLFRYKFSDVFISWLLVVVITIIIIFLFMIPASMAAASVLFPSLEGLSAGTAGEEVLAILVANGWSLVPAGLVFLVGVAITTAFSINATTNFYLQLKKKHVIF